MELLLIHIHISGRPLNAGSVLLDGFRKICHFFIQSQTPNSRTCRVGYTVGWLIGWLVGWLVYEQGRVRLLRQWDQKTKRLKTKRRREEEGGGENPPYVWKQRSSTHLGSLPCFPFNLKHSLLRQGRCTADHLTLLRLLYIVNSQVIFGHYKSF